MEPGQRLLAVVSGIAFIAGPVLLIEGPASAATATYTDPRPCSPTVNSGVCISEVRAADSGVSINLTTTVGHATDPTTDPNWNSQGISLNWRMYVNGKAQPSFGAHAGDVTITPTTVIRGRFLAEVAANSELPGVAAFLCDWNSGVVVTADTTTNGYSISFPASCIGSPTSLSVQAIWSYDTSGGTGSAGPGGSVLVETSPASGPCCITTPSRTLAFTGPGWGVSSIAVVGGALILLGLALLALFDSRRRVLVSLVYLSPNLWIGRVIAGTQAIGRTAARGVVCRTRWRLGR
jgi:hypothetical protein